VSVCIVFLMHLRIINEDVKFDEILSVRCVCCVCVLCACCVLNVLYMLFCVCVE